MYAKTAINGLTRSAFPANRRSRSVLVRISQQRERSHRGQETWRVRDLVRCAQLLVRAGVLRDMHLLRRSLFSAAVSFAVASGSVSAAFAQSSPAASWSNPVAVARVDFEGFVGSGFSFAADGSGYLGWFNGNGISDSLGLARLSVAGQSNPITVQRQLKVDPEATGNVLALSGVRLAVAGSGRDPGRHLAVQILGGAQRSLGVQIVQPRRTEGDKVIMAGAPSGRLAALVSARPTPLRSPVKSRSRLSLDVSSAGARFARPVVVSPPGDVRALSVAVDSRGDALAAWQRHGELEARWLLAGAKLGRLQRIAPLDAQSWTAVAISPSGRGELIWETQNDSNPLQPGPATTTTSVAGATALRGGSFASLTALDSFPPTSAIFRPQDAALPPHGGPYSGAGPVRCLFTGETPLAAWSTHTPQGFVVRAANLADTGATTQTVSPPNVDSTLASLAVAPDGTALLAWNANSYATVPSGSLLTGAVTQAASRPPGGSFGAATTIPGSGSAAIAAINPKSGIPLVAWTSANQIMLSVGAEL